MLKLFHPTFILTAFVAAVISYFVIFFIHSLDLDKRVYNHVPGECSSIPVVGHGAADMAYFDRTIFITSGGDVNNSENTTNAGIYAYKPDTRDLQKCQLSSFHEGKRLNPHGISIYLNMMFVTNTLYPEQSADRVDIFSVYQNQKDPSSAPKLRFQKSVSSQVMTGIRGIVAVGQEHFYVANRHYFRKPMLKNAEVALKMDTGSILYFDGKKVQIVVDSIPTPTGVDYDRRKRQLYVSCFSANVIYVYNANLNNVTKVNEIQLTSSPYFIRFDQFTSSLLIAAHPLKLRYLFYEQYPYNYYSPSQVVEAKRIKDKKGKQKWSLTQIYANDGATITAATSVMMLYPHNKPKQILLGNMHSGMLACDLTT